MKVAWAWMAAMGLLASGPTPAEPVVIHDSGPTRAITNYLKPLEHISPSAPSPTTAGPDFLARLFPVHTPELSPGSVEARAVTLPQLPQPIFLVGADPRSRAWLAQHRERLRQIQAVGFLVEAARPDDFQAMASLAQGLHIVPVSASELAQRLNLAHYPVLISSTQIEQ